MAEDAHALKVVDCWFSVEPVDDRVTLITEPYVDRFLRSNIWHVRGRDRDLVVDSGNGIGSLRRDVPVLFDRPVVAVGTHAHSDHMGGFTSSMSALRTRSKPMPSRRPRMRRSFSRVSSMTTSLKR